MKTSFTSLLFIVASASQVQAEDLRPLITLDDYPPEALLRGEQGPVTVEVAISEEGLVTECKVLVSAGWQLDRATCSALKKRARFIPATDDSGKPVASTYQQTIKWTIPGARPVRPKPNSTRM